jgi:hypothetical protein
MTPVDHEFGDILRIALHTAADSVEPADDGLDRIRHRMRRPWLIRQGPLMLNDCIDLVRLIGIRLETAFTRVRAALASGPLGAYAERIRYRLPSVAPIGALIASTRRHAAAHRGEPAQGWARLRPTLDWLRPALAVATAVVVVVAGVYGLAQLRTTLVLSLFPSSAPASTAPAPAGNSGQVNPARPTSEAPGGLIPSSGSGSHHPTPKASCSRTSTRKPTPTPTTDPPPSPTGTPSATPSTGPTDTLNPSSTPSALSSQLVANAVPMTGHAASVTRVVAATCTRSTPKASHHA